MREVDRPARADSRLRREGFTALMLSRRPGEDGRRTRRSAARQRSRAPPACPCGSVLQLRRRALIGPDRQRTARLASKPRSATGTERAVGQVAEVGRTADGLTRFGRGNDAAAITPAASTCWLRPRAAVGAVGPVKAECQLRVWRLGFLTRSIVRVLACVRANRAAAGNQVGAVGGRRSVRSAPRSAVGAVRSEVAYGEHGTRPAVVADAVARVAAGVRARGHVAGTAIGAVRAQEAVVKRRTGSAVIAETVAGELSGVFATGAFGASARRR
jgi:hypothetical protein